MDFKHRRRAAVAAVVAAVTALTALAGTAGASGGVAVEGLFNPRGIAATSWGGLVIAEQGAGAVTLALPSLGVQRTLATLPGGEETGPVDVAVAGLGLGFLGDTYVLMSGAEPGSGDEPAPPFASLLRLKPFGGYTVVADIAAYQRTDPDPHDTEGNPTESNPNGLAILGGGGFLVADAANNDLLLVRRDGSIDTVARFPTRIVPMPPGFPGPPEFPPAGTPIPSEAVPTAVAVGPDGAWYVSQLTGFPFAPGSASIWRIEPGTSGAECPSAACTVFAAGFTNAIDLAFGRDGTLYVLEIATNGLLSEDPTGALWAVRGSSRTELAPGQLLFPGGVAIGRDGALFVTTGAVFGPGAGAVVRIHPNPGDDG
jgi:sugar lactone lactonase YvrE